jgi:pyridoxine 5-phosphate synthase
VRSLILALDGLPGLRDATASADVDVAAAATLAELAGVEGVRLSVNEDLKPVREEDVRETRRAARCLELRMSPSPNLVKLALEARPDRVVVAADSRDGRSLSAPLDLEGRGAPLGPMVRSLAEAGIPVAALVAPSVTAVKVAHAEGAAGVEFYTGVIVDLPAAERAAELTRLGDAVRLASKLRLTIGLGGGLGYRTLPEVLAAAPAVERVAVGRAALARALLVGLDRALRDLRALVA